MFDYLPSTILDLHLITAMAGGWYLCAAADLWRIFNPTLRKRGGIWFWTFGPIGGSFYRTAR